MAKWTVIYGSPKGEKDSTVVEVPDKFKTAHDVREALVSGNVPDAVFDTGSVIGVMRFNPAAKGGFRVE
jgi:hypothetical protein